MLDPLFRALALLWHLLLISQGVGNKGPASRPCYTAIIWHTNGPHLTVLLLKAEAPNVSNPPSWQGGHRGATLTRLPVCAAPGPQRASVPRAATRAIYDGTTPLRVRSWKYGEVFCCDHQVWSWYTGRPMDSLMQPVLHTLGQHGCFLWCSPWPSSRTWWKDRGDTWGQASDNCARETRNFGCHGFAWGCMDQTSLGGNRRPYWSLSFCGSLGWAKPEHCPPSSK
mmetsp:Transcript_70823/g.124678  ORF Transcript_70823/g.124678 Transcript_70823/m.124678 type:complete len:225 (-) Transcript_70823:288-962(-)